MAAMSPLAAATILVAEPPVPFPQRRVSVRVIPGPGAGGATACQARCSEGLLLASIASEPLLRFDVGSAWSAGFVVDS
jgi:hypothetical protein